MTYELKLCQERCTELEDRLHKEKKLRRRVERDSEELQQSSSHESSDDDTESEWVDNRERNQGSMEMERKANHKVVEGLDRMQGRSGTCKNSVTCVSQNGGFRKKNLSQVCYKILAILSCFDPSNFKATSCSKAVTRQGNELLAYDCHQLTLFPGRISSYPKNFKMLLFVARVTEDVGDLSSLALDFCCKEITTESLELRIELLLFKKTPCWADFAIIGFV